MCSIQYVVTYSKGLISKLFKFFSLGLGSLLYVTEDSLILFLSSFYAIFKFMTAAVSTFQCGGLWRLFLGISLKWLTEKLQCLVQ